MFSTSQIREVGQGGMKRARASFYPHFAPHRVFVSHCSGLGRESWFE